MVKSISKNPMAKPIKQILIVDDDPDIGLMLKMMLDYKGYTVTVLERAEFAEETLLSKKIDLLLMDIFLSGANGIDLCSDFKKDIKLSDIPIIMMSAQADVESLCMLAGASDFLAKPFDMKDVIKSINNIKN